MKIKFVFIALTAFSALLMLPNCILNIGGYDAVIHGLWAKHFSLALAEGNFYPRIANNLYAGFGSLAFYFYPPLTLYADAFFSFIGNDKNFYLSAITTSMFTAAIISGLTCYFWLRTKLSEKAALLCAAFYIAMPMHIIFEFYMAKMVSQFWCYAWFPLILWGTEKTIRSEKYGVALLAISGALLFTTSLPISIIFPPFAFCYGIVQLKNPQSFFKLIAAWALVFALAAFYLLPLAAYHDFTNIRLHWQPNYGGFEYYKQFVDHKIFDNNSDSNNFVIFLCILLMGFFSVSFYLSCKKTKLSNFAFMVCLASIFMCFSPSNFIWQNFTLIQKVQFPWRFASVTPVFLVILAAEAFTNNNQLTKNRIMIFIITTTLGVALTLLNYDYNRATIWRNNLHINYDRDVELYPNYMPSETPIKYFYPLSPDAQNFPEVKIDDGKAEVLSWHNGAIKLKISGSKNNALIIRQFYFPAWQANINGELLNITRDEKFDVLKIVLPKDYSNAELALKFKALPMEKLGRVISIASLLIIILLIIRDKRAKV